MDTLKRTFLEQRFLKLFRKFHKLFTNLNKLHKSTTNLTQENYKYIPELGKDFDKLTNHLQNPTVLKITSVFIQRFYRMLNFGHQDAGEMEVIAPQITPQILLASYVIAGYPEFALSAHHHQLEAPRDKIDRGYDVYVLAKDVVKYLTYVSNKKGEVSSYELSQLVKSINMFANCFLVWKNADAIDKTNELIQRVYYTNKTIDEVNDSSKYSDEQRIETLVVLEEQKNKVIDALKQLNPNLKDENIELYNKLTDEMQSNYQKAYWDMVTSELEENNSQMFVKVINGIIDDFKKLRPNKEDFHTEVENKTKALMDSIVESIKKGAMDDEKFVKMIDNFIGWANFLQSPAREDDTKQLWNTFKESIEEKYLGEHSSYVPKVLEFVCSTIQDIKDDILSFYVMNKMK